MAGETTSTNMQMPVPGVGVTQGSQWATDINSCLSIIDGHTHQAGSGVLITPDGLNVNTDLTLQNNDLTNVRTVNFYTQSSTPGGGSDTGCLYRTGVDLYFIDGNGTNIQITSGGGVAGSSGTITGLSGAATASYNSGSTTFIFQSAALTSAYVDCSSIKMRNLTAASNALTIQAPAALASNSTITLPLAPGSTLIMKMDSSGVIAASTQVDGVTLQDSGTVLSVKNGGIGTTQLAGQSVTLAKQAVKSTGASVGSGSVGISASCNTFTTTSSSYTPVNNLSCAVDGLGSPFHILLVADGLGAPAYIQGGTSATQNGCSIGLYRNGSPLQEFEFDGANGGGSPLIPVSAVNTVDIGTTGVATYTYSIQIKTNHAGTGTVGISNAKLVAYEL